MVKTAFAFLITGFLALTAACAPAQTGAPSSPAGSPAPVSTEPQVVIPSGQVTPPSSAPSAMLGILEIRVTDPPPADVTKAIVYLSNIEVHRVSGNITDNVSDNASDSGGEWISVLGKPPSFDLMDVIGVTALLGSVNLTAGSFTQIRMDVDRVEVTTAAGDNFTAEVPSGKLKIVRPFSVTPGLRTVLTIDFDGEKSLVITGQGKAIFKPVVKLLVEGGKPAE
ncbi:MAG: DUF4382 domain-containing protein [Chloroflexi bacterium]|nr:DUF4382 domain-containing protein [Chloroflexota bacterium]